MHRDMTKVSVIAREWFDNMCKVRAESWVSIDYLFKSFRGRALSRFSPKEHVGYNVLRTGFIDLATY